MFCNIPSLHSNQNLPCEQPVQYFLIFFTKDAQAFDLYVLYFLFVGLERILFRQIRFDFLNIRTVAVKLADLAASHMTREQFLSVALPAEILSTVFANP